MLGMHLFDVHIDDPDQAGPHDFTIPALFAYPARLGAARLAILADKRGGGSRPRSTHRSGYVPMWRRIAQACSHNWPTLVAAYATAKPHRH